MGGGSIAGGVVLFAYLGAIGLCGLARGAARPAAERGAWLAILLALAVLAIEKAFHVESLLVAYLGRIAQGGGWYGERRGVQRVAIAALMAAGMLLAILLGRLSRRAEPAPRVAGIATVLLAAFVAVRTVSLHQVDRLLANGVGPLRISNVVELALLCAIGGAAAWRARGGPRAELAVDK